jgi:hypothetical protein
VTNLRMLGQSPAKAHDYPRIDVSEGTELDQRTKYAVYVRECADYPDYVIRRYGTFLSRGAAERAIRRWERS